MTHQLLLIQEQSTPPARARRSDPQTSKQAAAKVDVTSLERLVLQCLRIRGESTTADIAIWTSIPLVSISPRMKPLEEKGKVVRCGRQDGRILWRYVP